MICITEIINYRQRGRSVQAERFRGMVLPEDLWPKAKTELACQWASGSRCYWLPPTYGGIDTLRRACGDSVLDRLSPDLRRYIDPPATSSIKFVREPRGYQRQALDFIAQRRKCLIAMATGTGKTKVAYDAIRQHRPHFALVVTPKGGAGSALMNVWREGAGRDVPADESLCVTVLDGQDTTRKTRQLRDATATTRHAVNVVVANIESVWREPFAAEILATPWDFLIFDECHRLKSPSGVAAKFARWLADGCRGHVVGLTGTPKPNDWDDYWGELRVFDPGFLGYTYTAFTQKYAIKARSGNGGEFIASWRRDQIDDLKSRITAAQYWVGKDALGLPSVVETVIPVDLTPGAARVYRTLEDDGLAELGDGSRVKAGSVLPRMTRLRQMTSGVAVDEGGAHKRVCFAKREALLDRLDALDRDEKYLVFCSFYDELDDVHHAAESAGRLSAELSGRASDRPDYKQFIDNPRVTVLAAQIQAGGTGIDGLQGVCSRVGFLSLSWDGGLMEQALGRLHRTGQPGTVFADYYEARGTIDGVVSEAVRRKQSAILELVKYRDNKRG